MIRGIGTAVFLVSFGVVGQTFEVAAVKVHPEAPTNINITTSGPRFRASAQYVAGLVQYAYNLKNYQLAWATPNASIGETYFDIEAKAEGDAAPKVDEFRRMVQSLLADRFKLRFHHEMREIPVLALVVGRSGPKFKESAPDAVAFGRGDRNGRNQVMTLTKATMEDVVQHLPVYTELPVVDHTGLTGTYDVKLEATPSFRINSNPDPSDVSVFVAVQVQLGLKLEPQKAMIDILVVDHVEKPSGN